MVLRQCLGILLQLGGWSRKLAVMVVRSPYEAPRHSQILANVVVDTL